MFDRSSEIDELFGELEEKESELQKVRRDTRLLKPVGNAVAIIGVLIWLVTLVTASVPWIVLSGVFVLLPAISFRFILTGGGKMQVEDIEQEILEINQKIGRQF